MWSGGLTVVEPTRTIRLLLSLWLLYTYEDESPQSSPRGQTSTESCQGVFVSASAARLSKKSKIHPPNAPRWPRVAQPRIAEKAAVSTCGRQKARSGVGAAFRLYASRLPRPRSQTGPQWITVPPQANLLSVISALISLSTCTTSIFTFSKSKKLTDSLLCKCSKLCTLVLQPLFFSLVQADLQAPSSTSLPSDHLRILIWCLNPILSQSTLANWHRKMRRTEVWPLLSQHEYVKYFLDGLMIGWKFSSFCHLPEGGITWNYLSYTIITS